MLSACQPELSAPVPRHSRLAWQREHPAPHPALLPPPPAHTQPSLYIIQAARATLRSSFLLDSRPCRPLRAPVSYFCATYHTNAPPDGQSLIPASRHADARPVYWQSTPRPVSIPHSGLAPFRQRVA